ACVLVGVPTEKVTIYTLPLHFNKVLTGSHGGSCAPHVDIPRIVRLDRAGRISFGGLITHEFPLEDINTALDVVRSGTAGRVLLTLAPWGRGRREEAATPPCGRGRAAAHGSASDAGGGRPTPPDPGARHSRDGPSDRPSGDREASRRRSPLSCCAAAHR